MATRVRDLPPDLRPPEPTLQEELPLQDVPPVLPSPQPPDERDVPPDPYLRRPGTGLE